MANAYALPVQALENSRLALRDIFADQMAARGEESRLRTALATIAANKELARMDHETRMADAEFRMKQAEDDSAYRSGMLEQSKMRTQIESDRESRMARIQNAQEARAAAAFNEQRRPYTREQAFDRLGIGPQERLFINTIVPEGKQIPLQAYANLSNTAKQNPRMQGLWVMSKLMDKADAISQQPPNPENLKALKDIERQVNLLEIGVSDGALGTKDTIKARELLMEQWDDVAAVPEGGMYQSFMQAAGGDEAAAADLFVQRGINDLKRLSRSDPFETQAARLRDTISQWTKDATPKPPEGLAGKVKDHIDALALEQGPAVAGEFRRKAQALFDQKDWTGIEKLLPGVEVGDEMMQGHRPTRQYLDGVDVRTGRTVRNEVVW